MAHERNPSRVGFQARTTPAERRSDLDLNRLIREMHREAEGINSRLTDAENDIVVLDSRVDTAETDIDSLETKLTRVRWRGTRAAANISGGDQPINFTQAINSGQFSFTGGTNTVSITTSGMYIVSCSIGGSVLTDGSALAIVVPNFSSVAFRAQPGTAWHCGGTMMFPVSAPQSVTFTFRNAGAAVSVSATAEILKVPEF